MRDETDPRLLDCAFPLPSHPPWANPVALSRHARWDSNNVSRTGRILIEAVCHTLSYYVKIIYMTKYDKRELFKIMPTQKPFISGVASRRKNVFHNVKALQIEYLFV